MLSEQEKQAIWTMRSEGQSYLEIADTFALSPNTVKSICYRSGIKPALQTADRPDRCKNCGKPLNQVSSGRKKSFCSDQCRYAWWNQRRSKKPYRLVCYQCGKEFISYGNRKRQFCSRECYLLSRQGKGEGVP